MKVVIISQNFYPELTGIGKYSGDLAFQLADSGCDVTVISSNPYYPQWKVNQSNTWKVETIDNVKILRAPIWVPQSVSSKKRIVHLLSFFFSSMPYIIFSFFRQKAFYVVVNPSFLTTFSFTLFNVFFRRKSWLHVQDLEIDVAVDLGMVRNKYIKSILFYLERWVFLKFDKVSAGSHKMLQLLKRKGVNDSKLYFMPNWIDASLIYPKPTSLELFDKYSIPADSFICMYSGNLGEKQGLEIVIDAARSLQNTNVFFVLLGHGAAKSKLVNSAADLDNVIFGDLVPKNELNSILNFAHVHLLPQLANAADLLMPSKLGNMMASSKVVIATVDSNTEIASVLKDRGVIVPPGDAHALVSSILHLKENPELSKSLGEAARKYVLDNLYMDSIVSNFKKSLSSL